MKDKLRLALLCALYIGHILVMHAQDLYKDNVVLVKVNETAGVQSNTQLSALSSVSALNDLYSAEDITPVFPRGKFDRAHEAYELQQWYRIRFSRSYNQQGIESACHHYEDDPNISRAEPEYLRSFDGFATYEENFVLVPDDPQFTGQWHYQNTGQTGGTPGADISLVDAWDIQSGESEVVVAIIDQGIDTNHEDLQSSMWINSAEQNGTEGVDDDNNGYIDDIFGYGFGDNAGTIEPQDHGTHVGGTIAATNNNGIGVSGVAGGNGTGNGVRLMSLAVFGVTGQGGFPEAFVYAADNGAVIAQNSWGGGAQSQLLEDAIDYFIDRAGFDNTNDNFDQNIQVGLMAGGVVIFAAGNSNSSDPNVGYPSSIPQVIAVASTDHNDIRSGFSNYGDWIDIAAPGSNVLSTLPFDNYGHNSGTSMACPHVSGVAALIVSEFGGAGYSPDEVLTRLVGTTDNINRPIQIIILYLAQED